MTKSFKEMETYFYNLNLLKELSLCQKLIFYDPYFFAIEDLRFMKSVILNNLSLKYLRFAPSYCKDIWIRKLEFVQILNSLEREPTRCVMNRSNKSKHGQFAFSLEPIFIHLT